MTNIVDPKEISIKVLVKFITISVSLPPTLSLLLTSWIFLIPKLVSSFGNKISNATELLDSMTENVPYTTKLATIEAGL